MGTGEPEARWSRRLQAQAGVRQADEKDKALEGIGFLPPPAALSLFCCFPEGPNYHPLAEPGAGEILRR